MIESEVDEITAEKFLRLKTETFSRYRKHRVLYKMNPRRFTLRHTITKQAKVKDNENFKGSKRNANSHI